MSIFTFQSHFVNQKRPVVVQVVDQAQSDPWQQQREAMLTQLLESCPDEKNAILKSYLKAQCERERGETL